jgi:flavin reductase (DIM6/NTAB) family NADH-FMN oxidoreductase RutF
VVRVACTMHQVCNGGDHSILIGLVKAVHEDDALPLVYYNRSFSYPGPRMLAGRP